MISAGLEAELNGFIRDAQVADRLPSITAAAVHRGRPVWSAALGLANVEARTVATVHTQYRIGSITKMFTAAAVMQLRDAGSVDLDASISKYIPECPHSKVTIRDLLSHTSGLQMEPPGNVWEASEGPSSPDFLDRLAEAEQLLLPKSFWHYSNFGYALLGQLIARCSNREFEEVVDERLLGPLGMGRTTWQPKPPVAQGYVVEPYTDRVRRERHQSLRGVAAAAQLWSTSEDLVRWAAFLADPNPTVMPPPTLDEMHLLRTMADSEHWTLGWGLGPSLHRSGERVLAGHGGSMPGFRAGVLYFRTQKVGAAVLMNSGGAGDPVGIATRIILRLLEHFPAESDPWEPDRTLPAGVEEILGRWWSEASEWTFVVRSGELQAYRETADGKLAEQVFTALGADHFRVASGSMRGESLKVLRDPNGHVFSMRLGTNPLRREPGPA